MNGSPSSDTGTVARVTSPIWTATHQWRALRLVLVALAVVAIVVAGHELARHLDAIEHQITALGPWALATFVAVYVVLSIFLIPDSVFGVIAGVVFGIALGFAAVLAGTLLGAALQFPLARHLLRRPVEHFVARRPALETIRRGVRHHRRWLQALIRLTPINRALVSYVLASSGIGFTSYLLACLAHIPSILLEVWAGHAGRHLIHLRSTGRPSLGRDLLIFGGLVVAGLLMTWISQVARRAIEAAAAAEGETAGAG